ncbi:MULTISPECIES: ArnT family glycosyltransferase [unclassified Bacteroides]|uniref:ArnT family glycosyltransferase n=1 Tax=unclassified Bacteroides TaxID=2646097 RepID=UPI0040642245
MKSFTLRDVALGLLLISVVTIIPFLGLSEYHTKGEPREAIVSLSMIESGNWISPRNNGGELAYKPPFFHWSVAVLSLLNGGEVTEMISRMPSAIALISMVFFGFLFFAKRSGIGMALLAAFISLTNFELHRAGMNCRVDMVLTALTVGALYAFYRWYEKGLHGIPWLAVFLMSLGTLTKGPVGSLIPCLVMGVFLLLRSIPFLRAFLWMVACGTLSLLLPLCWYIAAYMQGGEEFLALVMEENFGRMTNTMSYESCVNPWYYNFITLIAGYVPWTLLLVLSLFTLAWHKCRISLKPVQWWKWTAEKIRMMKPVNLFAATSIVVIFLFYCFPQSKRSVYLMPIYPFIAYFIARYIFLLAEKRSWLIKTYGGTLAVVALLLFVCFLIIKLGLIPDTIFHGRHADKNIQMLHALQDVGGLSWILIVTPASLAVAWWMYSRHSVGNKTLSLLVALIVGIYLSLDGAYQPAVLNVKSVKGIAAEIDQVAPQEKGTLYEFISEGVFAMGDPLHFFEVNFYLHNRICNFYKERPTEGFLLIRVDDVEKFFPQFEEEGYRFEKLYRSSKKVVGQIAEVYRFTRESSSSLFSGEYKQNEE